MPHRNPARHPGRPSGHHRDLRPCGPHGTASWELNAAGRGRDGDAIEAILAGGYPYLVANATAWFLGYAYAGLYRPRPAYRSTVESSIYVAPAAQRRGVGSILLDALIGDARAQDFRLMVAVIGDRPPSGSIGLHASLGFEAAGVFRGVGHKGGRWLSTVLMQRDTGRGRERGAGEVGTL